MLKKTSEKKVEDRIIKMLEEVRQLNQDREQVYVGLDIAIEIIKDNRIARKSLAGVVLEGGNE